MIERLDPFWIERARAPRMHPGRHLDTSVPRLLRDWIDWNLPPPKRGTGRRQLLLLMFGNRVTRGAIRHWINGRRAPPDWVLEAYCECAAQAEASFAHIAAIAAAELERRRAP